MTEIFRKFVFTFWVGISLISYDSNVWGTSRQRTDMPTETYYDFSSSWISKKELLLGLAFVNRTNDLLCVRHRDLTAIDGNSFIITKEKAAGKSHLTRKDANLFASEMIRPTNFYIIPPGQSLSSAIKLTDYYRFGAGNYEIRYYVPVIFCNDLISGYLDIPSPHIIANSMRRENRTISQIRKMYKEAFPDWGRNGFIAQMEPIKIIVR